MLRGPEYEQSSWLLPLLCGPPP